MSKTLHLENQLKDLKEAVTLGNALTRLRKNKDFKLIFEKELFQDFAAQCVIAKGNPALSNEKSKAMIDADIAMIGSLYSRLGQMTAMATEAPFRIEQVEAEIERVNNGEDEE